MNLKHFNAQNLAAPPDPCIYTYNSLPLKSGNHIEGILDTPLTWHCGIQLMIFLRLQCVQFVKLQQLSNCHAYSEELHYITLVVNHNEITLT